MQGGLFFLILYTFLGPKSDHCLALVTQSLHPIVGFCFGFIKIDTWISLSCYLYLSKLLHELSKMVYGFLKVVMWICQRADDDISGNEDGPPG